MSTVARVADRVLGRTRADEDEYAYCPQDQYWFRPAYTEGTCPLCGEVAPGGIPAAPRLATMDRSWVGMAGLALESIVMLTLVLFMYFR